MTEKQEETNTITKTSTPETATLKITMLPETTIITTEITTMKTSEEELTIDEKMSAENLYETTTSAEKELTKPNIILDNGQFGLDSNIKNYGKYI